MSNPFFLAEQLLAVSIWDAKIWYAVPMLIAISLVYGATRHEYLPEILRQSFKAGSWILGFMAIIFVMIFVSDLFI